MSGHRARLGLIGCVALCAVGCSDSNAATSTGRRGDADSSPVCARCDAGGEAGVGASGGQDASTYLDAAAEAEAAAPGMDAATVPDASRDGEAGDSPDAAASGELCVDCSGACEETLPVESAFHLEGDIDYPSLPPAGGDHNGCWAPWGKHTTAVRPENWVHNLEHGGVILLYNCNDGCDSEVAQLSQFVDGHPVTLLSPDATLPGKFAAVAWGHRLVADCLDMSAVGAFYEAYFDKAPESISADPPVSCR